MLIPVAVMEETVMSSAVEFRVTPEKVASEEVNNARYLAAENIASLLNVLAPEQLEFTPLRIKQL